jgi:RNA-directed DNA polymerase
MGLFDFLKPGKKPDEGAPRPQKPVPENMIASTLGWRDPNTNEPILLPMDADIGKLSAAELPMIATGADLAGVLELTPGQLQWFINDTAAHYYSFRIPKRSGGVRIINAPKKRLKKIQKWILANILEKIEPSTSAHAFRKGHSIKTNAAPHAGQHVVAKFDFEDFFGSIKSRRVVGMFRYLGYSTEVSRVLGRLCTRNGSVPQGAPTSPAITNIVCRRLDKRMQGLAKRFSCGYTRYSDDMTFSGDVEFLKVLGRFIKHVRKIVAAEKFRLSEKKLSVIRRGDRQVVTGLTVNQTVNPSRKLVHDLRALIHNVQKSSWEQQNTIGLKNLKTQVRGQIEFIRSINPQKGAKLLAEFVKCP